MNPRENFHAMVEAGDPMRLPFDLQTTEPVEREIITLTGKSSIDFFDSDFRTIGVSFVGDDPNRWRTAYKNIGFHVPANAEVLRMGITFAKPPAASLGEAFHLREMLHPLAEVDDVETLEQLPWPDFLSPASFEGLRDQCTQIQALGKVATASLECTIFEDTWYLRGMDNVFCDWADDEPVSEWLLDCFTERSARAGAEFARAGFDLIRLGDDVGTQNALMMSLETWRRHLKPRSAQRRSPCDFCPDTCCRTGCPVEQSARVSPGRRGGTIPALTLRKPRSTTRSLREITVFIRIMEFVCARASGIVCDQSTQSFHVCPPKKYYEKPIKNSPSFLAASWIAIAAPLGQVATLVWDGGGGRNFLCGVSSH